MASRQRASVQKRQRERKKAEKAAQKREQKERRESVSSPAEQVATREDLEGYGVVPTEDEEPSEDERSSR